MKKHEITKLAQAEVMKLMAEGFIIDQMELTGSYSDVEGRQTVFAKGSERVVMWCGRETFGSYRKDADPQSITLHMARFTVDSERNCEWGYHWSHDWEPFEYFTATAWKVGDDWYTEDKDEAVAAREKRYTRPRRYEHGDEIKPITDELLSIVRRVKGFKTAKRDDIEVRRNRFNAWTIRNKRSGNKVVVRASGKDRW